MDARNWQRPLRLRAAGRRNSEVHKVSKPIPRFETVGIAVSSHQVRVHILWIDKTDLVEDDMAT